MNSVERYVFSHKLSFFLIVFLFFPYFTVIIFNGIHTALVNRAFDVEMILPVAAAMQIDEKYETETVKAQTVIARSNLYRKIKDEDGFSDTLYELRSEFLETGSWKKLLDFCYEKAAADTEGKVLLYKNMWKQIPYHQISAGRTREGEEVFHDKEHSYLQSVESSQDKESGEFLTGIYINENYLPEKLVIKERDSAGYVTELLADDKIVEGEAFRKGLGLVSANFTIQKIGDQMRFLCKGKGHGLGFSQYGGNEMAKDGKNYEEILNVYFPEMELLDVKEIENMDEFD